MKKIYNTFFVLLLMLNLEVTGGENKQYLNYLSAKVEGADHVIVGKCFKTEEMCFEGIEGLVTKEEVLNGKKESWIVYLDKIKVIKVMKGGLKPNVQLPLVYRKYLPERVENIGDAEVDRKLNIKGEPKLDVEYIYVISYDERDTSGYKYTGPAKILILSKESMPLLQKILNKAKK